MREAELAMVRRHGASQHEMLIAQSNLASTYQFLGRNEEALSMRRDTYSGWLKLKGEDHVRTLTGANNYANSLLVLKHSEEARSLLRKTIPMAQRALGESHGITLRLRKTYAEAIYHDAGTTLDDLREAVTTLKELERTARRVLGGAHPLVLSLESSIQLSLKALLKASPGAA